MPMLSDMQRAPVTIVIPAWNAWDSTRACLQSLRPTLGVHDQVVVVDNGSTDATGAQLRMMTWVDVVSNPENRGFAGGCNDGAAAARHGVIVFLNNDTLVQGHWLDALVRPLLDDPTIGATGPRSNMVSGPQQVDEAAYTSVGGMRAFARSWADAHRGQLTRVDRLVGFCLAVRRDAFDEIGGFDESYGIGGYEDDDLCRRLTGAGHALAICHESFVHHHGHRTFDANGLDWFAQQESNRERFTAGGARSNRRHPLVSACLIVKDEADNLTACLESLRAFADEVVVYDTGSTDGTQALARELGATVLDGYWDDDFARARNAALAHCRGSWIAWLDADETLVCDDPTALRQLLVATKPTVDAWSVRIDNLTGAGVGAGFTHSAARLFRRTRCEWVGKLHEQIARRSTHDPIDQAVLEIASIRHTGYLDSALNARNKAERNRRVAAEEVRGTTGAERAMALTSLARSLVIAGNAAEAIPPALEALDLADNRIVRRLAMRALAEANSALGSFDDAAQWIDRLRSESTTTVITDLLEATLALRRADPGRALSFLDRFGDENPDEDGFVYTASMLAPMRAEALAGLGRHGDAADVLLAAMADHGVLDTHLGALIDLLERAGRPIDTIADAIPEQQLPSFLAQLLQLAPAVADRALEALWDRGRHELPVLATAATMARSLPLERAMVWSSRLRAAGQPAACPVAAIAGDEDADPLVRSRAAAVAVRAFGDDRGRASLADLIRQADPALRETMQAETAQICPELAALFTSAPAGRAPTGTPPTGAPPTATPPTGALPCGTPPIGTPPTGTPPIGTPPTGALPAGPTPAPPAAARTTAVATDSSDPSPGRASDTHGGEALVSIVIPCWNQVQYTVACLKSVMEHTEPALIEIILVDNGSTDETTSFETSMSDRFLVLRNNENLGYGMACNQGAERARGAYVLFLNNDVLVGPRWLEPLVADMEADERLGAVQPRLLYPDGRLNDAGGLVMRNGDPWVYGKGHPVPDAPPFTCRRTPDYASGACLLVRRLAFEAVGGFDDRYAPAYFEDTDLSFALREAGWKLLYEPASTVVHVEGGTAGTDLSTGMKRYQVRNAAKFRAKWKHRLAGRPPASAEEAEAWAHRPQGGFGPGEHPDLADPAGTGRNILVLDPTMPAFDRAAGSLRQFHLLRALRAAGHSVIFYGVGGGDRRYARHLAEFGVTCYGPEPDRTEPSYMQVFQPHISTILSQRCIDTVIISPWSLAEPAIETVRQARPEAFVIVDSVDVHFRRLERAAAMSGTAEDAAVAAETRRREIAVYRAADRVVCVTDADADAVRAEIPDVDLVIVPTAHDTVDPGPGFAARSGTCFVGNFLHSPNADAVTWWRDQIAPELRALGSDTTLTVVGNDPLGAAQAMATDDVLVTGYVPDTLPYLHAALVSVAPLRFGAGIKGKVGEALAAGTPVVATSVAAEGMGLTDGTNVLVADDPAAFARAVVRLRSEPELWSRLREEGRKHVAAHFGLPRMQQAVPELLAPARKLAGTRQP